MATNSDSTNHDSAQSLIHSDEAKARLAFDRAIAAGILSADQKSPNSAHMYMFMGRSEEGDAFKHIDTRQYVYHKHGEVA